MKVTIRPGINHGARVWFVDYTLPGGQRKRPSFKTKALAEAHAADLNRQTRDAGVAWLSLGAAERSELIAVYGEVVGAGHTLRAVWDGFRTNLGRSGNRTKPAGEALAEFLAEQERALVSAKSLKAIKSNVGRFLKGRESSRLSDITRADVLEWLRNDHWGPRTFNTYRTSLHSFFLWSKKLGYLAEAPTATIDPIDERRMGDMDEPPAILSLRQSAALLAATLKVDKALVPYVTAGLFAGLRPEKEAAHAKLLNLTDGHIEVPGRTAKDRQRRFVEAHPTLQLWLDLGGEESPKNLRRRFEDVREAAGLIRRENVAGKTRPQIVPTGWAQDCLRHTFASHYLPVAGPEKTIAALGHGDYEMLFRHYRALVPRRTAELYWSLTPELVTDTPRLESLLAQP